MKNVFFNTSLYVIMSFSELPLDYKFAVFLRKSLSELIE